MTSAQVVETSLPTTVLLRTTLAQTIKLHYYNKENDRNDNDTNSKTLVMLIHYYENKK